MTKRSKFLRLCLFWETGARPSLAVLPFAVTALSISLFLLTAGLSLAAEPGAPILLWEGVAPGEKGDIGEEKVEVGGEKKNDGIERTANVSAPTIKLYPAPEGNRNGAAVLVCPGGGYGILASEHEGSAVCEWLNELGFTSVLLKYRVPRREGLEKHHAPLQDAQRAIGLMRTHAEEWQIDPQRIGVLGFSAGGHLAAMALSNPERSYPIDPAIDKVSCRPDFGVLIYPAYLVDESDEDKLSPELDFNKDSQPVFMAVASNDKWASSSARLYLELQRLKVPVEMHAFAEGGHGFGIMKAQELPVSTWPKLCGEWLQAMGLDKKAE